MLPFLKTKTYHISPKMDDLFFSLNQTINYIFLLTESDGNDPDLLENVTKICVGLNLTPNVDTLIAPIPTGKVFNWKQMHTLDRPLLIVFFGPSMHGLPELPMNEAFSLNHCRIFVTHSMKYLQNNTPAKQQFWVALKNVVNETKTVAGN